MAPLSCPLCCDQTFKTHSSLKYHILGLVDNLLCPSCNQRCDDLLDLADHLGRKCVNLQKPDNSDNTLPHNVNNIENAQKSNINQEIQVKVERADESTGNVDDKVKNSTSMQVDHNEIQDDPNMVYTCEMCDMTFSSVQEHLAKYHEGEEVVLETEEQEPIESQEDDFPFDEQSDDEFFDGISIERTDLGNAKDANKGSTVDTNATAESEEDEVSPITTKYILDEGKVRKLSEVEANDISDQSKIIEIHNCPNCTLQFPNMSHFKKHKCSNAKKAISKRKPKKNYRKEENETKEEFRYQCTFCLAIYSSLMSLNDHMKSHLVQDDTGMVQNKTITMTLHVCSVCNTRFPTYKQLRLHSKMHDPIKAKQVEPPVSYNLMGQLNINGKENNGERETFECPLCCKTYDREYEEVHLKSHEEQDAYNCLVCNRKFESKENLDMHTKAHSNTKKFTCSYCKKPFSTYSALEEHTLEQCQKREFACQYCGRRFSKPHEKVKHERIHTGEKPHVCQICQKSFRVAYCLTLHMRTHTGIRPYTCQYCSKRFKSHSVFNHHLKTHSDIRNYKCPFCPKAFKTAVQLAGHKNSHTKPFSCTECNRPFASLYAVKAHMETHKRENNLKFECWICGASYARSFALRDHISAAHGQDPTAEKVEVGEDEGANLENVENPNTEGHSEETSEQMTIEDEEYQVTGDESQLCQVQVLEEGGEGEGYVVHLQEVENTSGANEETHMEVVES